MCPLCCVYYVVSTKYRTLRENLMSNCTHCDPVVLICVLSYKSIGL
jgi:hypothetical protein